MAETETAKGETVAKATKSERLTAAKAGLAEAYRAWREADRAWKEADRILRAWEEARRAVRAIEKGGER